MRLQTESRRHSTELRTLGPAPRWHPNRLRPGRDPVRRLNPLPTGLDTPLMPPATGCAAALKPASGAARPALRAAYHPLPIGAPGPPRTGLHHGPRPPAVRPARGQPAIASSPARADRLRDPRHPPPATPLSSRPPPARADQRLSPGTGSGSWRPAPCARGPETPVNTQNLFFAQSVQFRRSGPQSTIGVGLCGPFASSRTTVSAAGSAG